MKSLLNAILIIATLVISDSLLAQSFTDIQLAPGRIIQAPVVQSQNQRDIEIWAEDFENGIPADWDNSASPSPAAWEYRGPATSPSNSIGTRGSCIAEGAEGGDPILSESIDNGFVIFDSNYWDDNEGPCGSFGTGLAPGPHVATLTTPVIDLSGQDFIGLSFTQYHKNFDAETKVQASVDGGEWIDIWVNDVPANNGESDLDEFERFNVSDAIGGEANVRIRFLFDGSYYFWMIDDIVLFNLEENNLVLENATYGDFDFENLDHETGFEYLEYSSYPLEMAGNLKFNAVILNYGSFPQTGVTLRATVLDPDGTTPLYLEDGEAVSLEPEDSDQFRTGNFTLPAAIGEYSIQMQAVQSEEEDSPLDNLKNTSADVSEYVYARDRKETSGIYVPTSIFNQTQYEVGNMFVITADGQACHSISAGLSVGTNPQSSVYAAIYKVNVADGLNTELVAETPEMPVVLSAYNTIGENNVMVLPFAAPITLEKDSAYLVVVGTYDGPEDVLFPLSGESPILTSFVRFFPNSWFYMANTPMVRMNFGVVTSAEDLEFNRSNLNVYPNPVIDEAQLAFDLESSSNVRIVIYDSNGRAVRHQVVGRLPAGKQNFQLNLNELSAGMYVVQVLTDKSKQEQVFIKK